MKEFFRKSKTITDRTQLPEGVTRRDWHWHWHWHNGTGTGTGTGTGKTNFIAPEVNTETVPQEDPYAYNKDLMNKYLAELFKEEEGIDR